MGREFKLTKDCYDNGFNIYNNEVITINPGVTVLVGANGIGKTTLLHQIRDKLKKEKIPVIEFDNLKDGGNNSISKAAFVGDFDFVITATQSSEGENIVNNIRELAFKLGYFVKTGKECEKQEENKISKEIKERWILLDAIDSGLSIDNVADIKEQLFNTILKHNFDNEIYIIVSANNYEMARNEQCFDVYNGKYVTFKDYDEYRNFIFVSKNWKNHRR